MSQSTIELDEVPRTSCLVVLKQIYRDLLVPNAVGAWQHRLTRCVRIRYDPWLLSAPTCLVLPDQDGQQRMIRSELSSSQLGGCVQLGFLKNAGLSNPGSNPQRVTDAGGPSVGGRDSRTSSRRLSPNAYGLFPSTSELPVHPRGGAKASQRNARTCGPARFKKHRR